MARARSWIVTAAAALVLVASAGAAEQKLVVKKAHIRRGAAADQFRLLVRARLPDPATYGLFDPRFEPIDLFVNGREILCVPEVWVEPDPLYPGWRLSERSRDRWVYASPEREIRLDLGRGIVTVAAADADLADIVASGATDVTVTLQLGDEVVETVVDFRETNGSWRLEPSRPPK